MDILIVYEDENIIAVNKPAGLTVHPDGKRAKPTLVDWISEKHPEMKSVGESSDRPGIVHRLDKETSGILLLAKNQETFLFLKKQFQEQEVKKTYKAIVYGVLKEGKGIIDMPIARSAKDFRQKSAQGRMRGKARRAITEYEVLAKGSEYSFVEVYPKTGRTHQIRVHFKSIGHPIVCDSLYAPKRECPKELGRLALHAFALEFKTPQGTMLRLEAPLPDDIKQTIAVLFPELREK